MDRKYCVAGHSFEVKSSNETLLAQMTNYEPFRVSPESGAEPIFVLNVEQNDLLPAKIRTTYEHIFTDNSENDMPRIEVYRLSETGAWLIRVSQIASSPICCEIECNSDFTQGQLHIDRNCQDICFCIDNGLMLIYAFRTAPLLTLEMHAAVVVKGNEAMGEKEDEAKAFLFLGHSGTGKSTHAKQWLAAVKDTWLLNDDNPILRVMPTGEVRVYGSPWSGKTPCYKNAYATVGAIVKLTQAPHNRLLNITHAHAYAYMLSSTSGIKIDSQMADNLYETIKHVIMHIPFFHLECLPNLDAAKVCYDGVQ